MTRRNLILGLIIVVAAVLIIAWALMRGDSQKATTDSRVAAESASQTPTVAVASVVSQELNLQLRLPGELQAFQDVPLYPKLPGFVDWIGVDRGSVVKAGQILQVKLI